MGNVNIPAGASLTVIDENNQGIPLRSIDIDGVYHNTIVGGSVYFEVIAADHTTIITYHLVPWTASGDAFVISNVYDVNSVDFIISTLPFEINVDVFLADIEAVNGGSVVVVDKFGYIRYSGLIAADDKLRVVSWNSTETNYYYLNCAIENFYEQDRIPDILPAADVEICLGESATLTVIGDFYGDYTVSWTNGIADGAEFYPLSTASYIVTVSNEYGSDSDTVEVIVRPLPPVDGPDQEVCAGESVILEATGGILYEWDNGVFNGVEFVPVATNEYHVTITNEFGCVSKDTVVVTVNPLPAIGAGADQEICFGEEVILSATGEAGFTWDNDVEDGVAFIPAETMDYHVSLTDANGCFNADTVTVTVLSLPPVNAGADQEICLGEEVTLAATADPGFVWDNDVQDGVAFSPVETMEYHVSFTDVNGCINTDSVTVTVHPLPSVDAGADQEICLGEEVILSASGDAGLVWDNGVQDGVAFVPAETMEYHVSLTDANGCFNTDTVIITVHIPSTVDAGADQEICMGEEVTLTATGDGGVVWDNDVQDGVAFTPLETVEYHVLLTDANGCTSSDTVTVTVHSLPSVDAGADQEICLGEELTLTATGDAGFVWDNDVTDGVAFTPVESMEYHVSLTDANGCFNADTVIVTVNPIPDANAGEDQEVCFGESVTLLATGGTIYAWENGISNGESIIPEQTDIYEVVVTNEFGCNSSDQVEISVMVADTSVTVNDIVLIANASDATYQWINCNTGEPVAGATDKSYIPGESGSYAVEITQNGCIDTSSCYTITVIGIDMNDFERGLKYYPNPVDHMLHIDLGERYDEIFVRLYDISGRVAASKEYFSSHLIDIEMDTYSPGVYFIEIITNGQNAKIRVIKEK